MKTIMTSNWRPLGRALCTLLLGIAALWSVSGNAGAQIYVTQGTNNTVGEYNAITGAAINANFITGLAFPAGLAVSGNKLFVTDFANEVVGEYDATTGAAINPNFITRLESF